jgi:gliding-associated putative ABC transporter substrate-binding component GldG
MEEQKQLPEKKAATPKQQRRNKLLLTILALIAVNFAGYFFFKRFDLTKDKRYTLSQTSLNIVGEAVEPVYVRVFLAGDVSAEYKRLQDETRQLLQEFEAYNPNVKFEFFNPLDESESADAQKRELIYDLFVMNNPADARNKTAIKESIAATPNIDDAVIQTFIGAGMQPASVSVVYKGKQSETTIFPWALATYNGKSVKIPLLKNQRGATAQENIESSVQNLEYAFADAFNKVVKTKQKRIVFLQGNGEMDQAPMGSFLTNLKDSYFIGPFLLQKDSVPPQQILKELLQYDMAVIAKPRAKFTENEKLIIDQYIVNGGKTLWLVDPVVAEMDSLSQKGTTLALPNDLNLNDMFFKYGFRILPDLVKDEMATPIKLATGQEGASGTQYQNYLWKFAPFVYPDSVNRNPIVKNLDGVKLDFAGGIDTLKNGIKKNVLLATSHYSKRVGTPSEIRLETVMEEFNPAEYPPKSGFIPVAVLLEGSFRSMYENRLVPFKDPSYKVTGKPGKMIVISDGDIVKNQFDKDGRPLELGYDKWTGEHYDNLNFMMNAVNYLLDDTGLINIRSKDVSLPMLNTQKVYDSYNTIQIITVGVPVAVLALFGVVFTWLRRRKYAR